MVAECGAVNGMLASLVATGQVSMPSPEEREAFYAAITTRAEALAVLEDGTQKLYAAIDGVAPDQLGRYRAGTVRSVEPAGDGRLRRACT